MDSNSTQLCRLCLDASDDSVNIFEKFQNSGIASILEKHFWFQVHKNDGFSEWLCQICWIQVKTFHHFYKRIEFRHVEFCRANDITGADLIKQEQNVSPREQELESDLNLVKYEEVELPAEITQHFLRCKQENRSEYKDQSENSQSSDDDAQLSDQKPRNDGENQSFSLYAERKNYNSLSRSEKKKQEAQIREFFNMNCEICKDIEFETFAKARQHYHSIHKIRGYLTCCGSKFKYRYRIMDHIRYHMNPDALRCDQCDKRFEDKYRLQSHMDSHLPLELRVHKCSLCSKNFSTAASLKGHVENKHSDKKFPCDKCEKSFRSKWLLAYHIRSVHEFSLEHVCEICARQFKTKQILKSHIACEHSAQSKVQCNICGAWLKHKLSLRAHLKRHQDVLHVQDAQMDCPICQKVVKNKNALNHHLSYAHSERRFKCGLCDKEFKVAKNLKEHVALHTGEDLYSCPYCERKFKSNGNMYSHRKKAHLVEWTRDFPQLSTKKSTIEQIQVTA